VIRRSDEELEHGAKDAVEAEATPIDVVAEQDEHRIRDLLRILSHASTRSKKWLCNTVALRML